MPSDVPTEPVLFSGLAQMSLELDALSRRDLEFAGLKACAATL